MNPTAVTANGSLEPIAILGVSFDNVTLQTALDRIEGMIASGRPHYMVTANVDFLVQARTDVELRRILLESHLVLCDGTPVLWASRLLGNPLPERVAGADLVPRLIQRAASKGYRLFFLGATPTSCESAVARMRDAYPDLIIAGHYSPPFNRLLEMDHDEIRRRITQAQPDLLLVSFGCPKQEKWIAMHYRSLGVPVSAGVGATIDFLAGTVRRAPVWMQRTGTEWMFRLAQEPRRLAGRYGKDLWVFGWSIAAQAWCLRRRSRRRDMTAKSRFDSNSLPTPGSRFVSVRLPETFDLSALQSAATLGGSFLEGAGHCLVEADGVKFIDSSGVGRLIRWQKTLRAGGCELVLLRPSRAVQRAMKLMCLDGFIPSAPDIAAAEQMIASRCPSALAAAAGQFGSGTATIHWHGEVTAARADAVWTQTESLLARFGKVPACRLDLSRVNFIDSTGLGLLVRFRKTAGKEGFDLKVTGTHPAVLNVIRLAHLEEFLFTCKSEQERGVVVPQVTT